MIRWGILGCGNVTEVKSGPGFQRAQGSALQAVMRRDAAKAEDYARRHGVPQWHSDADALIHNPKVDAVYIATPVGHHLEYALRVCEAGKPCYVEKPMARNATESRRMMEAFSVAGLPLFVAYYRRALPRFCKARELIAGGELGRITSVTTVFSRPPADTEDQNHLPWRLNAAASGGGYFVDMGCHTLDILDFILGPLQEVCGRATKLAAPGNVEDTVAMLFSVANGAAGTGCWTFAGGVRKDQITITGTRGQLCLSTFGNDPLQLTLRDESPQFFDLPNPEHIQQPLIQSINDELHGNGQCPSSGGSALRTAQVMDSVLSSYYGGREDAFWARPATWPGSVQIA